MKEIFVSLSVCHCLQLSLNLLMHSQSESKYLSNQSMHPFYAAKLGQQLFFSKGNGHQRTTIYHLFKI